MYIYTYVYIYMKASRVCLLLCKPLYTSMKRSIQSDLQQSKLIEYIDLSVYLSSFHPRQSQIIQSSSLQSISR